MFCKRRSVTLLLERGSSIAKFLRTLILKIICERMLLKISVSVANSEAVIQRFSVKKVLLEFCKLHSKSPVQSLLFHQVAGLRPWHRRFPVNIMKFLRPPFFIEHLWWLLLQIYRREAISDFFYPFKSYPKFCYGGMVLSCNMFFQGLSDTVFFSCKHDIFIIKKL